MHKVFNEYEAKYIQDTYFSEENKKDNYIKDINNIKENISELSINREIFKDDAIIVEFKNSDNEKCLLWFQLKKYPELFKYANLEVITNLNYFNNNDEFKELLHILKEEFEDYGKISISIDASSINENDKNILERIGFFNEITYKNELGDGKDLISYSILL